jgi:hypothetical protein
MAVKLEDLAPVFDSKGTAVLPIMICDEIVRPCILKGKVVPGYYICVNGNLWSTKYGFTKLSPSYNSKYPNVGIRIPGREKGYPIELHRLVCQTWYNKPYKPDCISDADWEVTPESVRRLCDQLYEAHHIDHNTRNHHPSNLKWETRRKNIALRQEYDGKLKEEWGT